MSNKKSRSESYPLVIGVALLLASLAGFLTYTTLSQSTVGYASGYEGAKVRFLGVFHDNKAREGSFARGTTLNYDPDDPKFGLPNLEGEMTTIFIPDNVRFSDIPDFVPQAWTQVLDYIDNPDEAYEWEIKIGDETHFYRMEKWITKWYVTLEAGYDSVGIGDQEGNNKRFNSLEVWFEIETSPSWYFEDAENAYFAIAKIEVANIRKEGHNVDRVDVTPESTGTALFLFYDPYGGTPSGDETQTYLSHMGQRLNPDLFGRTLYTMITLNDFGTQAWFELIAQKSQGDIVTYEFTVHQFVVGEWVVKDIQDIPPLSPDPDDPDQYGRDAKTVTAGFDFWSWAGTSKGLITLAAIMGILVGGFFLWIIINTSIGMLFMSMLSSRGKKSE